MKPTKRCQWLMRAKNWHPCRRLATFRDELWCCYCDRHAPYAPGKLTAIKPRRKKL